MSVVKDTYQIHRLFWKTVKVALAASALTASAVKLKRLTKELIAEVGKVNSK